MDPPFANGGNGESDRDPQGRFLSGNKAAHGRGNPHAGKVNAWRRALAEGVSECDLGEVVAKLVERAKAGERWAVCELLDRCLGKPVQAVTTSDGEVVERRYVFNFEVARPGEPGPDKLAGDRGDEPSPPNPLA